MRDSQLKIADRELAYTDLGAASGTCLFFFHGAPLSRLHLVAHEADFAARSIRVITPDRPGYGRSSPQPGRTLLDWPRDVAALADALGIERFRVAGHSSGGPYAVVCAALLGERVQGGIVLAGVTDMAWPEAWPGYLEDRVEAELLRLPDEQAVLERCSAHYGADGSGFMAEPFALPEPDLVLFVDPATAEPFNAAFLEAFRQGVVGYAQDMFVEGRGWPFDPHRITCPMTVVHGEQDTLVPLAHSRHTADVIPGATLRVLPGHGHMAIVRELPALAA